MNKRSRHTIESDVMQSFSQMRLLIDEEEKKLKGKMKDLEIRRKNLEYQEKHFGIPESVSPDDIYEFEVRGVKFRATAEQLCKHGPHFLSRWFSKGMEHPDDKLELVDPHIFQYILKFQKDNICTNIPKEASDFSPRSHHDKTQICRYIPLYSAIFRYNSL